MSGNAQSGGGVAINRDKTAFPALNTHFPPFTLNYTPTGIRHKSVLLKNAYFWDRLKLALICSIIQIYVLLTICKRLCHLPATFKQLYCSQ